MRRNTPSPNQVSAGTVMAGAIVILLIVGVFSSITIVQPGEVGIVIRLGAAQEKPLGEGIHFIVPVITQVEKLNVRVQKAPVETEAASQDLQVVKATIVVNYRVEKTQAVELYRELGRHYLENIIEPAIQESFKADAAKYTAEELITERAKVSADFLKSISTRLEPRGVVVEAVNITSFDFSEDFKQAIEQKVIEEQAVKKAENELERIKVEADQAEAKAKGEAAAILEKAQAEAEALELKKEFATMELIWLTAVEKWTAYCPPTSSVPHPCRYLSQESGVRSQESEVSSKQSGVCRRQSFSSDSCILTPVFLKMKDIGEGTIRRIDWTELTPVVLLLRVFNVALGVRVLAIALLGLGLTTLLYSALFLPLQYGWVAFPLYESMSEANHELGWAVGHSSLGGVSPSDDERCGFLTICYVPLNDVFWICAQHCRLPITMCGAFISALNLPFTYSVWEHPQLLLWLPGFILIWVLCGGMICRIVALRLTVDESESMSNLFLFLRKRGIGFASSLIILSLGIFCCVLPVIIAHWLSDIPGLGILVAILLPVWLPFAFLTVILTLGLTVGWMLLFAAVSTDGSDGFDAISRMFAYIFQRPLHYLCYWFCCGILGCLGFLLMWFIGSLVEALCGGIGNGLFWNELWRGLVPSLLTTYAFAWFWTSSVAIYLLLRRSVDATPFNEVYRVAPPKIRTLPTIKRDERGAPEIKPTEPQS